MLQKHVAKQKFRIVLSSDNLECNVKFSHRYWVGNTDSAEWKLWI